MNKPVVLLAFANAFSGAQTYLRALPEEMNRLRKILEKAADDGLCELVLLPNATLDDLVEVFQKKKYRNRISVFHYGGHADSYELLLEATGMETRSAHAGGLLPLIAGQQDLRLVFLNGCFSARQATELLGLGVPAVIGTVKAVNDNLATNLAAAFYSALAEGAGLELAWKEATLKMQAEKGPDDLPSYYQSPDASRGINLQPVADRFPWDIQYREGAEEVRQWNLPQAASNPYFGLPPIPAGYGLPEEPFQFLRAYSPREAKVFFGRGKEVRAICQRLANPLSAPLLLLHGQSGVGKSSLLHAGVAPRLETDFQLIFLRREADKGLRTQLQEALGIRPLSPGPIPTTSPLVRSLKESQKQLEQQRPHLPDDRREQVDRIIEDLQKHILDLKEPTPPLSAEIDIRERWRQLEKASGKKALIVILDQVEEIYTRPRSEEPAELENLIQDLQALFGDLNQRPAGKLVLSYRKEFNAEISKTIRGAELHHEQLFIERLDQTGLEEVVNGLASTPELQHKYRLDIEPGLSGAIADYLLSDVDTAVSPVLQIVLSLLWKQERDKERRQFRIEDFHTLRREGVLLKDFFDQQLTQLRKWEMKTGWDVERSGLVLDILQHHTTPHGTANSCSLDDLRQLYQHRERLLAPLLEQCKSLYLLSEIAPEKTSLAHDTLALLVQNEARVSDRPGQRASRILHAKMIDYLRSPQDTVIEPDDLRLVEAGVGGMRKWHLQEAELVGKSRRHRRKVRLIRTSALVFLLIAVVATGLFFRQLQVLDRKQQLSELTNESLYQNSEGNARIALAKITAALTLEPDDPNALQIRNDIYQNNEFYSLRIEAPGPVQAVAWNPLDSLLLAASGSEVLVFTFDGRLLRTIPHEDRVLSAQWTPDGKAVATGCADHLIRFWGLDGALLQSLAGHTNGVSALAFLPTDQSLFSADRSGCWIHWASDGKLLAKVQAHAQEITGLTCSFDGKYVATSSNDSTVQIRLAEGRLQKILPHGDRVFSVQFAPDDAEILTADRTARAQIWDVEGRKVQEFNGHGARVNQARFSAEGKYVFTCSDDRSAACWDRDGNLLKTYRGHGNYVNGLDLSPSADFLLTCGEDGAILRWPRQSKVAKTLGPQPNEITALFFSENGNRIFAASGDGELRSISRDNNRLRSTEGQAIYAYDLATGEVQRYEGHTGGIRCLVPGAGTDFFSGGKQGELIHWGPEGLLSQWKVDTGSVEALAFHPQSGLLSGGSDHQVVRWDQSGAGLTRYPHPDLVSGLAWSPDGLQFASACLDDTLRIWTPEGQVLWRAKGQGGTMEALAWSPDGQYIAVGEGGPQPVLSLYEVQGSLVFRVITRGINKTGGRAVTGVVFSPDSRFIACSNEGGAVEVYNLKGTLIQRIEESDQFSSRAIRFSPDGKWITMGSDDGKVRLIWPIDLFSSHK